MTRPMAGKRAQRLRRKKVTERDVAVSKTPTANAVVSKIMTYNVVHVTAHPEIQLLNRLGGLFTSSLSLTENIEAMLRATSQMMQFDAATVFLLNEGSRELTACATYPHQDMVPHIARFVLGEGILGYAVEQLRDDLAGKITEKQRKDCLDNIYNSGRHLLSLINDVLDLTKIEAGRMDLVYEEFGVESAIREVLNVLRSLAIKKEIDIASTE